jgi:hypothetical protein
VYGASLISRGAPGLGCHAAVFEGMSVVCKCVCILESDSFIPPLPLWSDAPSYILKSSAICMSVGGYQAEIVDRIGKLLISVEGFRWPNAYSTTRWQENGDRGVADCICLESARCNTGPAARRLQDARPSFSTLGRSFCFYADSAR